MPWGPPLYTYYPLWVPLGLHGFAPSRLRLENARIQIKNPEPYKSVQDFPFRRCGTKETPFPSLPCTCSRTEARMHRHPSSSCTATWAVTSN